MTDSEEAERPPDQKFVELTDEFDRLITETPREDLAGILAAREAALKREAKQQKETIDRLSQLASKDPLTGLDNRYVFDEEFDRAVSITRRTGQPFTFLSIDMDKLRDVNNSLGHPAGDTALREFANFLVGHVRLTDRVFRLGTGADEFGIILQGANAHAAIGVVDNIRRELEILEITDGKDGSFKITASFGVSPFYSTNNELISTSEIKAIADANLLRAKRAGRNRIGFIDTNGRPAILEPDPENPIRNRTVYPEPPNQ